MADPIPVYNSPPPLDPADYETVQEAIAAADPAAFPSKVPYPTGSPLSREEEALRAAGDLYKEAVS